MICRGNVLTNPVKKWLRCLNLSAVAVDIVHEDEAPASHLVAGVNAARHLAWYVNYQVNGETRPAATRSARPLDASARSARISITSSGTSSIAGRGDGSGAAASAVSRAPPAAVGLDAPRRRRRRGR